MLTLLADKLLKEDDKTTRSMESYNKAPTEAPPTFCAGKHSIKRFYNTVYKQWRLEQKLHQNDDFIWFHKCFPQKQRTNIFNILSTNKNKGMDSCLNEIAKFFALSEIEIFDLREKFITYKQKKNESTLDVFNALYDLQSSIMPGVGDMQIIQECKTQFVRTFRSTNNSAVKNLFCTERWKTSNSLDTIFLNNNF